jgi:4-amino-4-deoxy-L-arabinose transferase-like glycosyltransferase
MKLPDQFRLPPAIAWTLLLVVAATLLFFELGDFRTLGSHEAVAAVPAREMVGTGDWIVPRYATVPRLQKPPVVYWLIAINGWVCGSFDECVVRLHSAFAALGLLALMSFWAARWYGREAAFGAALIQATSVWVLNYGRRAEVDMFLCLVIATALFLVATQPDTESLSKRRLRYFGLLSLLGLSWMCKFHYGPAMVLGPAMIYWAVQSRWRSFFDLFNPLGIVVTLACIAVWPWLVWRQLPEAMTVWKAETVGRAVGELGRDPWWFYLPNLIALTMPWTFNLLRTIPRSWCRAWQKADDRERFVWIWLAVDLGLVWLSPDKHENYLLAAMPPMTLLACQSWAWSVAMLRRGVVQIPKFVPWLGGLTSIAVGVFVFLRVAPNWPSVQTELQLAAICLAITLSVACWSIHRRQWPVAGWTTLAGLVGCYLFVTGSVIRANDRRLPTAEFAQQLRKEVLHEQSICMFGIGGVLPGMNPVVYYLQDPVCRANTAEELTQRLQEHSELFVIIEKRRLPMLKPIGDVEPIAFMEPKLFKLREPLLACVRLRAKSPEIAVRSNDDRDLTRTQRNRD